MTSNNQIISTQVAQSAIKEKRSRRDTLRKKKATISDHQDNGGNKNGYKDKQMLLTNFMKNKKTNNQSNTSTNSTIQYLNPPTNKEILLEEQIKKKNEIIIKLQEDKQIQKEKTNKMAFQYIELTSKTKKTIIQSKKQLANFMRKQRGKINPQFGHFKQVGSNNFIQGQYLTNIKSKINELETMIKQLQSDKSKFKDQNGKLLQSSRIQFNKKELSNLKFQLQIRQKQIDFYKQRLRLYNKEINSIFAKDNWPLIKNRYQPLELVGNGGFGQVYRGFDLQKFQDVAIKIHIIDSKLNSSNTQLCIKYLKRQIQIHKALEHPNIVKMIDQIELESNKFGIVMQYCSGPELKSYLRKQGCLDERQAKQIIKQVIYAVKYLHDQKYKIIHYDLKPANILFHYGIVKIVDFGISKKIENDDTNIQLTTPGLGTYWYLPPEVFEDNHPKVSSKVDVWSIGVIFFEMLYGKKPFGHGINQSKILSHNVIINSGQNLDFPVTSPKKYKISEQAKSFIQACLKYNPDDRLNPLEAYQHQYIKF